MSDKAPFLFIHAEIDDFGLKPNVFRLLAHLWRRAGTDGIINSSKANMSRVCRLHVDGIEIALDDLIGRSIISEEERPGQTTIRRINPFVLWTKDPGADTTGVQLPPGCPLPPGPTLKSPPGPGGNSTPRSISSEVSPLKSVHKGVEIPEALNTDAFKAAWNDWTGHTRARARPLSPQAAKRQLAKCQRWGETRAVAIINECIEKNYLRLIEQETGSQSNGAKLTVFRAPTGPTAAELRGQRA